MVFKFLSILIFFQLCSCDILHFDDSDYERMPPLFGLDPNYDRCLKQKGGVYCVAKFELDAEPHNELIYIIREYSQYELRHYNRSFIDRAVCVTTACDRFMENRTLDRTEDLNKVLEECINDTISRDYGIEAKLAQIYTCDKYGDEPMIDFGDWAVAAILTLIIVMNLIGSIYDIWYYKNLENINKNDFIVSWPLIRQKVRHFWTVSGNPYLLSFSIFRNWKQLSRTDIDPRYERLKGLHGLKSIITFFVASSHIMWLVGTGYTDNPEDFEQTHSRIHYQLIFSGMVIVQIYFVMSSCLLVYSLQVRSETRRPSWDLVPKMIFARWARLTPANAIMIFFTATWLRHLGSGPLWKLNVASVASDCRNHWWQHLLYFNNYVKQDKACAVQSWHMAAEMQLFTVGVVVYMATVTRGRWLALSILGLIGMLGPALHVWLQDLDALVLHRPEFYRAFENDTYRSMHVLGHNNLSCYAIGMLTGIVSHYCVKNRIEYPNSKFLKVLTWCVPFAVVGWFLTGSLFYVDGERPHVNIRMAYAAVHRPALGAMVAFLVLGLVLKFETVIRSLLEWRGWVVTSRLSYGVYLLHVNFIHILLGARTQLSHVSFFHVVINHFGVVSLTLMVSVPFFLCFEAPLMTLIKNAFLAESSEDRLKKIK